MSTSEAGRKRWKGTTKKERTEQAQEAARIFWDSLTPEPQRRDEAAGKGPQSEQGAQGEAGLRRRRGPGIVIRFRDYVN